VKGSHALASDLHIGKSKADARRQLPAPADPPGSIGEGCTVSGQAGSTVVLSSEEMQP
jgi:hypothetical protein